MVQTKISKENFLLIKKLSAGLFKYYLQLIGNNCTLISLSSLLLFLRITKKSILLANRES